MVKSKSRAIKSTIKKNKKTYEQGHGTGKQYDKTNMSKRANAGPKRPKSKRM